MAEREWKEELEKVLVPVRKCEEKVKRTLFRVKWFTMSDKDRYAYLWQQTRESMYGDGLYSRYGCMCR
jgi:hypothetical protein